MKYANGAMYSILKHWAIDIFILKIILYIALATVPSRVPMALVPALTWTPRQTLMSVAWVGKLTSQKMPFIGKNALAKIKEQGVTHKLAGLKMGWEPITWYAADFYHVFKDDELVGYCKLQVMQLSWIAFALVKSSK